MTAKPYPHRSASIIASERLRATTRSVPLRLWVPDAPELACIDSSRENNEKFDYSVPHEADSGPICRSVNVEVEETVLAPLVTATPIKTFAPIDIVSEPSCDQEVPVLDR